MSDTLASIFSRPIHPGAIGEVAVRRAITATAAECAALAAMFGLPAITSLTGDVSLRHERAGVIFAQLELTASVIQTCVITLEPFSARIRETAFLSLVPSAAIAESAGILFDPETLDGPDEIPYTGEVIDLGAILAEQLALALDPYPRKPGARLPVDIAEDTANPFAVLDRLKGKPEN